MVSKLDNRVAASYLYTLTFVGLMLAFGAGNLSPETNPLGADNKRTSNPFYAAGRS